MPPECPTVNISSQEKNGIHASSAESRIISWDETKDDPALHSQAFGATDEIDLEAAMEVLRRGTAC